jgi:hypothetical protein
MIFDLLFVCDRKLLMDELMAERHWRDTRWKIDLISLVFFLPKSHLEAPKYEKPNGKTPTSLYGQSAPRQL